jgi:hypothetical protein
MSYEFRVLSETFPSAAALERRIRNILNRRTGPLTSGDEAFVRALLSLHPDAGLILADVTRIEVEIRDGGRGFAVVQPSARLAVGWRPCLTPPTRTSWAKDAFRYAIQGQIDAYRDRAEQCDGLRCFHCGCKLLGGFHVDHHPMPFSTILAKFIQVHGLDLDKVETAQGFNREPTVLVDEDHTRSWQAFHKLQARYVVSCPACNMHRGNRGGDRDLHEETA